MPADAERPERSVHPDRQAHADEQAVQRARSRRRRRIDELFGDVLPSVTGDEREAGERGGFSAEHYRANTPPHHGGT